MNRNKIKTGNFIYRLLKETKVLAAAVTILLLAAALLPLQTSAAASVISDPDARRALPVVSNNIEDWPLGPIISAQSAVVMEVDTGAVLYEKNAHDPLYPASITKILTTLVALENSSMDETVKFSYDSLHSLDSGSSIIGGVEVGDTMTMEQVLYGIMICSGNEAAYAAAEHIGGNVSAFVEMMNARAKEIGCTDSNFCNPHGLPDDDHVTSSMDMALITTEALKNSSFEEIATTRRYVFPPTDAGEERVRTNHHLMMEGMQYAYSGVLGGKTGYTSAAGATLVTFAERDGMMLVCVVMNEEKPVHFADTATLLDYSFANFHKVDMSSFGRDTEKESGSFFLTESGSGSAGKNISVRQSGMVCLPLMGSTSDLKGTAVQGTDKTMVRTEFSYNGADVGDMTISIHAASDSMVSDSFFAEEGVNAAETYDVFHPSDKTYLFINVKYVGAAAGVILVIILIAVIIYKKRKNSRKYSKKLVIPKKYEKREKKKNIKRRRRRP